MQQSETFRDEESKDPLREPLINPSINYDRDASIAGENTYLQYGSMNIGLLGGLGPNHDPTYSDRLQNSS